ncbi:hypothetical protein DRE_06673 [Drechslerella stenobrocha 248]|uniref:glucan endo-1,3-beta-D-glucosidase n=1 Tax=Drechslerella stenobrocha 248 TaxID=1043628 RepID=W7HWY5_9PEZI|nr:hypothetical protein DRE_06673 [Drechslerella stenobrocha 248]
MVAFRFTVLGLAALSIFGDALARPHSHHLDGLVPRDAALHRHVARDPKKSKQKPIKGGSSGFGKGIVYSPYCKATGCKTKDTINKEIKKISETGEGYKYMRLYGTDCDQLPIVLSAAGKVGMTVMLGIYDLASSDAVAKQTKELIAGVQAANKALGKPEKDWSLVNAVSVGNEWLFNHPGDSPEKCLQLAGQVRTELRAAGYNGPVTNTDVWTILRDKPQLCGEDQIVTVNMHPFFDANTDAASAGEFLKRHVAELEKICKKPVIVAETGWPNAGSQMAKAKPGVAEQAVFLKGAAANLKDYCLLSAYDEDWKEAGLAGVEPHWGIYKAPA